MNTTNIFVNLAEQINNSTDLTEADKQRMIAHIMSAKDEPVNLLITGPTGCGKSSTINAMFNMEVAKVGVGVDPETMEISEYTLGNLRIFDSPGLGDGKEEDAVHANKIRELLRRTDGNGNALIDLVLVIVDGSSKDLGTTYDLIEKVIIPELGNERNKRLLIAVNQADVAMKGKHWDDENYCPDKVLTAFLNEKIVSIRKRILENTGIEVDPIYYCAGYKEEGAEQLPPYNLSKLLLYILRAIPWQKRLVIAENVNPDADKFARTDGEEDYNEEIKKSLWDSTLEGAKAGGEIGSVIGGAVAGKAGEALGRAVGAVIGGIGGFIGGLFG